jgi:hypothetical protein
MISQNEGLSEEEIKKLFSMTAEVGLNKKEGETLLSIQKELADLLLKIYFNSLIIHDDTIALDEKVKISQLLLLDKSLQGYATGRQNKPLEEEPNKEQVATVDLDEDEEDSIDKILEMKNSKHHLDFYALMIQKGARGFLARRTFTRLKNTESILVMVKVFVQREETLACAIMKRASVNEYTVYAYNDDSNYYFHPQHVNMQLFGANDSKRLCLDYKIYEKVFEQTYFDMDSTRLYPHDYLMEEFSAHANPLVRIDSNERYKAEFLIQKALRKERKGRVDRLIPRIESNFILVGKRFMFYQHLPVSLLVLSIANIVLRLLKQSHSTSHSV